MGKIRAANGSLNRVSVGPGERYFTILDCMVLITRGFFVISDRDTQLVGREDFTISQHLEGGMKKTRHLKALALLTRVSA